jgi:hypothetical protein
MSLFSMSGLRNQEHFFNKELLLAFQKSSKQQTVTPEDRELTNRNVVLDLCCVNYWSRIRWSKAFCKEVAAFFGLNKKKTYPDQPIFFITLTDISCTTDHDAPWVNIYSFKRKLQAGLKGLHYVGMVEPGLYVNVCPGTRWSNKKAVSWHLHAICWGENRREMKKRFCRLNRENWYLSILHSQRGADQKEIPDSRLPKNRDRTFLADKLRYVLKSPKNAYRIYKTHRTTCDGEVVPCFKQKKSKLRNPS